ncbi:unnamed protein product [Closterium sp. Naga37s-1]|nr:unnamed protein product [Closterium sp. Naga37s-1]
MGKRAIKKSVTEYKCERLNQIGHLYTILLPSPSPHSLLISSLSPLPPFPLFPLSISPPHPLPSPLLRPPRVPLNLSPFPPLRPSARAPVGDTVMLRPPAEDTPPYVARVESIEVERADTKVRLRWFYRPEESLGGRRNFHGSKELFLSDHFDVCSMDAVEGVCRVHSFKSYVKLAAVEAEDYFYRFEYKAATGTFKPDHVAVCVGVGGGGRGGVGGRGGEGRGGEGRGGEGRGGEGRGGEGRGGDETGQEGMGRGSECGRGGGSLEFRVGEEKQEGVGDATAAETGPSLPPSFSPPPLLALLSRPSSSLAPLPLSPLFLSRPTSPLVFPLSGDCQICSRPSFPPSVPFPALPVFSPAFPHPLLFRPMPALPPSVAFPFASPLCNHLSPLSSLALSSAPLPSPLIFLVSLRRFLLPFPPPFRRPFSSPPPFAPFLSLLLSLTRYHPLFPPPLRPLLFPPPFPSIFLLSISPSFPRFPPPFLTFSPRSLSPPPPLLTPHPSHTPTTLTPPSPLTPALPLTPSSPSPHTHTLGGQVPPDVHPPDARAGEEDDAVRV